ncbi:hypothetical protein DFJ73DRAFT_775347 [Zopfochytrium polystomum]|nr:hypothetical protein DFJ73DRAFT_775347 [Zopfochytrium polystomum]
MDLRVGGGGAASSAGTSRSSPANAAPSGDPLTANFKAAALAVTQLFKEAQSHRSRAFEEGYVQCIEDLVQFLAVTAAAPTASAGSTPSPPAPSCRARPSARFQSLSLSPLTPSPNATGSPTQPPPPTRPHLPDAMTISMTDLHGFLRVKQANLLSTSAATVDFLALLRGTVASLREVRREGGGGTVDPEVDGVGGFGAPPEELAAAAGGMPVDCGNSGGSASAAMASEPSAAAAAAAAADGDMIPSTTEFTFSAPIPAASSEQQRPQSPSLHHPHESKIFPPSLYSSRSLFDSLGSLGLGPDHRQQAAAAAANGNAFRSPPHSRRASLQPQGGGGGRLPSRLASGFSAAAGGGMRKQYSNGKDAAASNLGGGWGSPVVPNSTTTTTTTTTTAALQLPPLPLVVGSKRRWADAMGLIPEFASVFSGAETGDAAAAASPAATLVSPGAPSPRPLASSTGELEQGGLERGGGAEEAVVADGVDDDDDGCAERAGKRVRWRREDADMADL